MWDWLTKVADVTGLIGFVISIATLGTALAVNKKVNARDEKRSFGSKKQGILDEVDGFIKSLDDGLYTVSFLNTIDARIDELKLNFEFFGSKTQRALRNASKQINRKCLKEIAKNESSYKHKLRKLMSAIRSQINKEDSNQ